jgi:hypothetical protein
VAHRDTLQVFKIIVKYCEEGGKENECLKKEKIEYNRKKSPNLLFKLSWAPKKSIICCVSISNFFGVGWEVGE